MALTLRFGKISDQKVSFIGRGGSGKTNPIVEELVEAHRAGKLGGDNGLMITAQELAGALGVKVEKALPQNITYSFFKRTGIRMGYRRALNASGERGFWLFTKVDEVE